MVNEYLGAFKSDLKKYNLIDRIEEYYEEIDDKKERLEMLGLLSNPNVQLDFGEDESEDD